ncbi:MAG: hypothetical protein A3A33_00890 [Candidatus Yanofskybacteria bacterium RIFCSPLOWO2_01_FULL_49_25]|uniref:HTH luxR-type domain-containing protein n=1 Tax=Candidatus Yanofskybacteria bacterium RIFCSPLOWO2_01_FULL_49_25 TaxID=1802701 RepID=A0A1F8GZD1_9BACT|nr:MAG: hypothetical protein A3A33_00890 [Candidatus Yanofskybacteria bacterium RIFCSPLOWO2_01_FULL_49_25]
MIDEADFSGLYDKYARKIYTYCYFRVRSREEAEDIASQTFTKAWDHVSSGKDVENVAGFLYRIAHNLIIDHYRKGKSDHESSLDDPLHPIDIPIHDQTSELLDRKRREQEVFRKLEELPEPYQEVIVLRYVNELAVKEIAIALAESENTVSVRIHRALAKLKSLL